MGYTGVMGQPPMPQIFTKWQQRTIPKGRVLVDRALPCGNIFGLDWGWFTVSIGFKHTKTCHTSVRGTILHIEDNGQGSYSPSLPVLMSLNDGSHETLSEDYIANNNHIKQQSCRLLAILKKARASGGLL